MTTQRGEDQNGGWFVRARQVYLVTFFSFLLLRAPLNYSLWVPAQFDDIMFTAIAVAGAAILLLDWYGAKNSLRTPHNGWLFLFLLCCGVSSLVWMRYGIQKNVWMIVWTGLQMLLFCAVNRGRSRRSVLAEIRLLSNILVFVWSVICLFSLGMFFLEVGYTVNLGTSQYRQGFYDMRLFGVLRDPNYNAVTSIVAFLMALFNFRLTRRMWLRVLYVISAVIQAMHVVLSGSRTAQMAALAVAFAGAFLYLRWRGINRGKPGWKTQMLATLLAVVFAVTVNIGLRVSKTVLQYIPPLITGSEGISLTRPDVENNDDITNSRAKIWRGGLQVWKTTPVVGTSPQNTVKYARDRLPDGYIAQTGYVMHNGYLEVLVCTGVLGASVLLCYLILYARKLLHFFFWRDKQNNYRAVVYCLLVVITMMVAALFLSEIFFINSIGAMLFWMFLGYTLYFAETDSSAEKLKLPLAYRIAARIKGES